MDPISDRSYLDISNNDNNRFILNLSIRINLEEGNFGICSTGLLANYEIEIHCLNKAWSRSSESASQDIIHYLWATLLTIARAFFVWLFSTQSKIATHHSDRLS